ncbi:MAG TPA: DUF4349 domain-containing protein [Anaerolineales bacterium]|nr:DUF4349 domain-containing protein [Anaerolineales bacterium]
MKRILFIILAVVTVFVVIGLSFAGLAGQRDADLYSPVQGFGGGAAATEAPAMPPMELPASDFAYDEAGNVVKSEEAFTGAGQVAQERMVIQTADLAIVVTNPQARMEEISKLATDLGGYVVSSNMYQSYTSLGAEVPEASIVIRVPAQKLDQALAEIKEGAVDIDYENRSGQDVTNIYVDLQSQLKAKEAAEEQLLEIMDQATRAEDVLAVYMQVQAIQTEIEQLKGQIQYYEESAALSSVSVRLIAEEATQPIEVGPWKAEGAVKDALEDLIRFLQNFAEFLIRFVIFILPALILIAIPLLLIFLGGRALYRRYNRSKVVEEKEIEKK